MSLASEKLVPAATYRIQFTKEFGFRKASELAPYLSALGVSHLYASPYLKARPGSTHGYDIVDHNALNPELGSEDDFNAMCAALKQHGIGQILDFVPNHMGVGGSDNVWWLAVLEWGSASAYAGYFDIDWASAHGKVLVPVLGDQYGAVLESGALELRFDADAGAFAVWAYGTHKLPICPLNYDLILGIEHPALERLGDAFSALPEHRPHIARRADELKAELAALVRESADVAEAVAHAVASYNAEPDRLDTVIQKQHWRAAFFKVAADDINYRRFFNINELAGLRMEQPELFDLTHRFVLERLSDGTLDGIRIDHIDGLLDPRGYCVRLREHAERPFYLVVEKILARHERLREDWPIEGTTGYEFANLVGGLFIDPAGERPFTRLYEDFTGRYEAFETIVYACKVRIMETEMASELNALARGALRLAQSNRRTRDFTHNILHAALKETVARFPVYRTYIDDSAPTSEDRRDIDWAIAQAKRTKDAPDGSVFDFLHAVLTTDLAAAPKSGFSRQGALGLAMKIQQYSGPVMAKGLEDTAFYRYNRLVSLNEVGGQPDQFGVAVSAFHQANAERAKRWPHAMLATSTHDTKRGEDVRARLNVLSEIPEEWERQIQAWTRIVRARRGDVEGTGAPDRNDEYLLYQLLVGAWPTELTDVEALNGTEVTAFAGRIEEAMIKSVREAKVHSTWAAPNEEYEEALKSFVRDCLDTSRSNPFLESFKPFQSRVARLGMLNSLSQTLIKLTAPGLPDLYQGTEFWDLSLVDPDNRRAVDYAQRKEALAMLNQSSAEQLNGLLGHWKDGAIKLALASRTLTVRKQLPALFSVGSYEPLQVSGKLSTNVCAFARVHDETSCVVVVPRLLAASNGAPDWANTTIKMPERFAQASWRDALSAGPIEPIQIGGTLLAKDAFRAFPVALLISEDEK